MDWQSGTNVVHQRKGKRITEIKRGALNLCRIENLARENWLNLDRGHPRVPPFVNGKRSTLPPLAEYDSTSSMHCLSPRNCSNGYGHSSLDFDKSVLSPRWSQSTTPARLKSIKESSLSSVSGSLSTDSERVNNWNILPSKEGNNVCTIQRLSNGIPSLKRTNMSTADTWAVTDDEEKTPRETTSMFLNRIDQMLQPIDKVNEVTYSPEDQSSNGIAEPIEMACIDELVSILESVDMKDAGCEDHKEEGTFVDGYDAEHGFKLLEGIVHGSYQRSKINIRRKCAEWLELCFT